MLNNSISNYLVIYLLLLMQMLRHSFVLYISSSESNSRPIICAAFDMIIDMDKS